MEQSYQFRTAVGGFHKGDVAEYISKTAAAHQAALAERDSRIQTLEEENLALARRLEQRTVLEEPAAPREPAAEAQSSEAPPPTETPVDQLELAAYRRAEAAERLALRRSQKLYETLNDICRDLSGHLEKANGQAQETVNSILARMDSVTEAYTSFQTALSGAKQRLAAMDAMAPDPAEGLEETE